MRLIYIGFRSSWEEKDFWHTHQRAFKRYKLPLLGQEIIYEIPRLIKEGKCQNANYNQVPKKARKKGFSYLIVPYKSRNLVVVFNKKRKRITTLLEPQEFRCMHNEFERVFEKQIQSDLAYRISRIINNLIIKLEYMPSKEKVHKETGIPLKELSKFPQFFN